MAISRYRNSKISDDGKYFETFTFPSKERLNAIATIKVVASRFERLDNLAFTHLGGGEYWWVIALINDLEWPYKFEEGQILRIPVDIQDVLKLI